MKKLVVAIVLLSICAAGVPVFGQTISKENLSDFYYVNISVEMVYLYRAGYVIRYRKIDKTMATLYLPHEWFTTAGGKGELVTLPKGKEWPSLTIYYKNGEFSHVRLYVHWSHGHSTWGVLPMGIVPMHINIDDRFKDVETLNIEY